MDLEEPPKNLNSLHFHPAKIRPLISEKVRKIILTCRRWPGILEKSYACLRVVPPSEALRRAGASEKAGGTLFVKLWRYPCTPSCSEFFRTFREVTKKHYWGLNHFIFMPNFSPTTSNASSHSFADSSPFFTFSCISLFHCSLREKYVF